MTTLGAGSERTLFCPAGCGASWVVRGPGEWTTHHLQDGHHRVAYFHTKDPAINLGVVSELYSFRPAPTEMVVWQTEENTMTTYAEAEVRKGVAA